MSLAPSHDLTLARTGTFTSVDGRRFSFTPQILQDIADSYDPQAGDAPLVIGHPKLDAPAYGWAASLKFDGAALKATPHKVHPAFAAAHNSGAYKHRSMSIFLPDTPGNPKPGHHYLRHIGFLGAAPPAIPGLPEAQLPVANFAAGDGALEFASFEYTATTIADLFQRLRDWMIERDGLEAADKLIPQWQIRAIAESPEPASVPSFAAPLSSEQRESHQEIDMSKEPADFAARESALQSRETDIAAREQAIKDRETADKRNAAVSFAAQLAQDGKLLPAEQNGVVELLVTLDTAAPLSFAAAGTQVDKPAQLVLRELLSALPSRIDYREKSKDDRTNESLSFAAPAGVIVDAAQAERYSRAEAYQREHPNTEWIDCVHAVGG